MSIDHALVILSSSDACKLDELADNRSQPVENRRVADLTVRASVALGDRQGIVGEPCVDRKVVDKIVDRLKLHP